MARRRSPGFAADALLAATVSIILLTGEQKASALDFFALFDREQPRREAVETPTHIQKAPAKAAKVARRPAPKAAAPSAERVVKAESGAKRDLPLFGVVSISDQRISIYNHNGLVTRSPVSTGMEGHATPRGIFTIIGRERYHQSNIYSGAPMPFMQRITWSGIAMHVGVVPGHPASHGCVRLPADFAARLWGMTKIGERIVISPDDVSPTPFAHASLPGAKIYVASGPAMQAPVYGPPESGEDGASPVARLNPLQYAERLKGQAAADAAAASKALREASAAAKAAQDEAAAAARELAAAESAEAAAQLKADDADEAYLSATARAHALQEEASLGSMTDDASRRNRFANAMEAAVKARVAAATLKIDLAKTSIEARRRHETARSGMSASQAQLSKALAQLGGATASSEAAAKAEAAARRRLAPVSVLFSKKDQRVYVRQGLSPLFEAPIAVRDPDRPLGSHLFIATAANDDATSLKWSVLSMSGPLLDPAEALERIEMSDEIRARIGERLWTGGSMIVSDQSPSGETGAIGTDLTVKLR
ncbi:L,D-transpeptidase family protein [Methylocystis sp. IM3]|uniref:L,D-transpeptidase family protein n=1 Tax=unclassified Methylocystis TaxID=2625913 RepID=UPI0030FCF3EC